MLLRAAAACPKASTIKTPGITGWPGKWPSKKNFPFLTLTIAVADFNGTILIKLSIKKHWLSVW